jgi:NAD(P)H-dependent nitrite reductase small subunit
MSTFVNVARLSELHERRAKFIRIADEEIALFKVEGKIYAINNVCAHQHFSMLHKGELNGLEITCPMHGWTYSLETGKATSGSGSVKTYQVKVLGDTVLVAVE